MSNKCGQCGASTVETCNANGCFYLENGNGEPKKCCEDLTPSEEAELGVTRTADGVSVGGFTFGAKTRITHQPICCGSCPGGCVIQVIT